MLLKGKRNCLRSLHKFNTKGPQTRGLLTLEFLCAFFWGSGVTGDKNNNVVT